MKAFLLASRGLISPFGQPAEELEVGAERLADLQDRLLREEGLEPVRVERLEAVSTEQPCLLISGDLYFTRRVLRGFLRGWARDVAGRVALPAGSVMMRELGTLQRFARAGEHALFELWGIPKGARLTLDSELDPEARLLEGLELSCEVRPVPVPFREKVLAFAVPERVVGRPSWSHPVTSSICLHLEHWVHVLQAGRASIQVRWVDEVVRRPLKTAAQLAWALLPWPGRGGFFQRVLSSAKRVGRGARIHPTAVVEGAILGEGVRVGAFAIVRGSIVGAGTVIEDRATVAFSVVGANSFVSKNAVIYASAAFSGSSLGMSMQMCLAGREVALTPRATPIDVIPGGQIKVSVRGRLVPAGLPVLGSCFGHRCFVGADVYLAPGREVPNDRVLGPRPGRVIAKLDPED